MMAREILVTVTVSHPFPCDKSPLIIAAAVPDAPGEWRASATVNCTCGTADVLDVEVHEKRRQVKTHA
jgi:hypothetical protein